MTCDLSDSDSSLAPHGAGPQFAGAGTRRKHSYLHAEAANSCYQILAGTASILGLDIRWHRQLLDRLVIVSLAMAGLQMGRNSDSSDDDVAE
jgi:hypothetical protein